ATAAEDVPYTDGRHLHGPDGLGGAGLEVSKLARQHPAEKLISDEVRAAPDEVTIVCLGPLTNLARALTREPDLTDLISRIVIRGGAINGIGNVTPCAEANIYADPAAARAIFRSPITNGATIFDRRPTSSHRAGIEVAMEVDAAAVSDWLVRGLAEAGRQT